MTRFIAQRRNGALVDIKQVWLNFTELRPERDADTDATDEQIAAVLYGAMLGIRLADIEPTIAAGLGLMLERLTAAACVPPRVAEQIETQVLETLEWVLENARIGEVA